VASQGGAQLGLQLAHSLFQLGPLAQAQPSSAPTPAFSRQVEVVMERQEKMLEKAVSKGKSKGLRKNVTYWVCAPTAAMLFVLLIGYTILFVQLEGWMYNGISLGAHP
jgi:hypothetical protein